MPTLREVQSAWRVAILDDDARAAAAAVRSDGLPAAERLAIYRHHVLASLTAVLESTYPVVARLVDPRFFRWAAHCYIRQQPPVSPCLFEYGATLPEFLARFEPCHHLAYLPDVARLEWAMNTALNASDVPTREPATLLARVELALHPSVTLLVSPWPVDAIWRANQPDAGGAETHLDDGGVRVQIWRVGDEVLFRALSPAAFAVREALARTRHLHEAAAAALEADPAADLAALIRELLDDGVLV